MHCNAGNNVEHADSPAVYGAAAGQTALRFEA